MPGFVGISILFICPKLPFASRDKNSFDNLTYFFAMNSIFLISQPRNLPRINQLQPLSNSFPTSSKSKYKAFISSPAFFFYLFLDFPDNSHPKLLIFQSFFLRLSLRFQRLLRLLLPSFRIHQIPESLCSWLFLLYSK